MSAPIDQRIRDRARADGDGLSRTLERFVNEADGRQDQLRAQFRVDLHNIARQCAAIAQATRQPAAIEAVKSIEQTISGMAVKLASR